MTRPNRCSRQVSYILLILLCGLLESSDGLATTSSGSSSSVGERIQASHSAQDLLQAAADLWLPTDPDLPSHLISQRVHHEKRQRWSAQILSKLGRISASSGAGTGDWDNKHIWGDKRLGRAVLGAALPFDNRDDGDNVTKEGRYVKEALLGLHNLLGYADNKHDDHNNGDGTFPRDILDGTRQLIERAENMADSLSIPDAAETRWACRGILARAPQLQSMRIGNDSDLSSSFALPRLDARARLLPFDIVPRVVQWKQIIPNENAVEALRRAIPFSFDTIVTRTGTAVTERRGTAWIAEEGIGALAYSGKLMPPRNLPGIVRAAMRLVEDAVLNDEDDFLKPFFDCALCNHYPDGESSCKFHTDPEHGTHWDRLSCVVAAGDARRFAFRPIPGLSSWSFWSDRTLLSASSDPNVPAVITLFPGDVVVMWGECNDKFHHAVYPESLDTCGSRSSSSFYNGGRVSLVFKRAIPRGDGRRGHSLAGQGRRSRRQRHAVVPESFTQAAMPERRQRRKRRESPKAYSKVENVDQ